MSDSRKSSGQTVFSGAISVAGGATSGNIRLMVASPFQLILPEEASKNLLPLRPDAETLGLLAFRYLLFPSIDLGEIRTHIFRAENITIYHFC